MAPGWSGPGTWRTTVSSPLGLYGAIEQFYARQIRLLGDGEVVGWGETFTQDAVFEQDGRLGQDGTRAPRAVWRGRAAIVSAADQARGRQRVVRRYWVGMLTVTSDDAGCVRTGYHGALFNTSRAAGVDLFRSTHGTDLLVRVGDDWLVAHRRIDHDDVHRG
jgi:SnoaL-like domain